MTQRSFVVPLLELERGPQRLEVALPPEWLAVALEGTEATPRPAGGKLAVELTLTGTEVMVRGRLSAALSMPCVRTLDPVDVDIDTELFLLLGRGAEPDELAGRRRRPRGAPRKGGAPARAKGAAAAGEAAGAVTAPPRPAKGRRAPAEDDRELSPEEAARDVYTGEAVVLDPFLREFILLELPMMPVRPDLREAKDAATSPPPQVPEPERPLDPRLAPLAELKRRLRSSQE